MRQIERQSVIEQINSFLKQEISAGKWKVGEKIPSETVLTKTLGVSRASLRTAIGQFVALGILRPEQGKGCFLMSDNLSAKLGNINGLSAAAYSDIRKVLSFRLLIEPEACYLSSLRTGHDRVELLSKLNAYNQKMRMSVNNANLFIEADQDFHIAIGYGSGNELIGRALEDLFVNTERSHHQINDLFGFKDGLKFHSLILDALEDGDGRKARKQMQRHLESALVQLEDK